MQVMKSLIAIILFMISSTSLVLSQDAVPSYAFPKTKSVELKIGAGKLQPQLLAIDFNYQQNLTKHFSLISFSQIDITAWDRNPDKIYLVTNYFFFVQSFGIGASIGARKFNTGLSLLAGGRFYHSKAMVNEIHDPEMVTNRILPELGLLYNLKIGKKKYYFSTQIYLPLTPFSSALIEKNITLSVGIGFKIN
jgi:hypothetical protein